MMGAEPIFITRLPHISNPAWGFDSILQVHVFCFASIMVKDRSSVPEWGDGVYFYHMPFSYKQSSMGLCYQCWKWMSAWDVIILYHSNEYMFEKVQCDFFPSLDLRRRMLGFFLLFSPLYIVKVDRFGNLQQADSRESCIKIFHTFWLAYSLDLLEHRLKFPQGGDILYLTFIFK